MTDAAAACARAPTTRIVRLAQVVARALQAPCAVIDALDGTQPTIHTDGTVDAAAVLAGWPSVPVTAGALRLTPAVGPCLVGVAFDATLDGAAIVVAALDGSERTLPFDVAAVKTLVDELDAQWHGQQAAIASWVRRLEQENRQMARAQRLIGVGTLTFDAVEERIDASPSALDVLGVPALDTLEAFIMAFDPFDRAFVHRTLMGCDGRSAIFDFERQIEHPDGRRAWVRVHGETRCRAGSPSAIFATVQDVTAGRAHMSEMQDLAERDALTGVYNRTMFERATREALARAEQERLHAALFLVDIDNFKEINDTFGHPAGDEILKFVARVLTSLTRASDTVLRLAGDEFAVIVSRAANTDGIMALAERIARTLCADVGVGGDEVALSTSIGVAIFPEDVSPKVDIYKACDHALLEAKSAGRRTVRRFDPCMREARELHRSRMARVRASLARGEFVPYFQPKHDLQSGVVVGFEALCRWEHPERGTLGPAEFAAAFDDRDLGGPLSDVSLHGAFRAAAAFRERGLSFGHVAINLNRAQLQRPTLVADVRRLGEETGVPTDEIVFEVLENVLIRDDGGVYDNLTELSAAGYRVALDDFGTGFASLTHVREPFIRELKIDRSFVSTSANSSDDHQIVAAIVQLAGKMGLTMVAEGIEDEETLRCLRALGCTVGQGFVFSRALPFDEAIEFLARQSRIRTLLADVAG
ncbi:putative bifunctional diguanylate cyclase/phosphodiesterase [Acuticoccus sp.]|uniref:putative bifunctional diguanylate cyclase/phosphodiesterase n=1 Tax=Acuticoccus sp. TaxID=1904378 RepID=UPI003B5257BD